MLVEDALDGELGALKVLREDRELPLDLVPELFDLHDEGRVEALLHVRVVLLQLRVDAPLQEPLAVKEALLEGEVLGLDAARVLVGPSDTAPDPIAGDMHSLDAGAEVVHEVAVSVLLLDDSVEHLLERLVRGRALGPDTAMHRAVRHRPGRAR